MDMCIFKKKNKECHGALFGQMVCQMCVTGTPAIGPACQIAHNLCEKTPKKRETNV